MDAEAKRKKIKAVAKLRFRRYGFSKTKMSEISKDLSISINLLKYYYADKNTLYLSILEDLTSDFFNKVDIRLSSINDLRKSIEIVLETKNEFFIEYFYLLEYPTLFTSFDSNDLIFTFWQSVKEREKEIYKHIIYGQIKPPIFVPERIIELMVQSTTGLQFMALAYSRQDLSTLKDCLDKGIEGQCTLVLSIIDSLPDLIITNKIS